MHARTHARAYQDISHLHTLHAYKTRPHTYHKHATLARTAFSYAHSHQVACTVMYALSPFLIMAWLASGQYQYGIASVIFLIIF